MSEQVGIRPDSILDADQMELLEGYANGKTAAQIGRDLEMTTADITSLELDTRARLSATSSPHMISRAWQLGILFSRVICLILCFSLTNQLLMKPLMQPDYKFNQRPARTSRTSRSGSRTQRSRKE